ncbi:HK97 gp10 family phage protein [Eubacteriales bacterium OttesenSCG-928-A19]|nr:HK97 gp10 family phage protein [Eubacteriales bacterium OttesenSCG-928-A19]
MAKATVKMPEEFLKKVSRLAEKTDEIVESALEAGGEVMLSKVSSNLSAVVGKDTKYPSESTGELEESLGLSPVKIDRKGVHNIKVGFSEPRRKQTAAKGKRSYYTITNAMLANVLEYGKHGQPPKPFLKPARRSARKPCMDAMEKKLQEEIDKL